MSKLKEFAFDYFDFVENGKKFFKQVENTLGKKEFVHIALDEHSYFSLSAFKRLVLQTGFLWGRVKRLKMSGGFVAFIQVYKVQNISLLTELLSLLKNGNRSVLLTT